MELNDSQSLESDYVKTYQDSALTDFLQKYFGTSLQKFNNDVWGTRELIALNFDYFKTDRSYVDYIDRNCNYLYVESNELWNGGEQCMERIFKYLDREIVEQRRDHWRKVYLEWQMSQLNILKFNWYLPTIVDSIINNYNFDLSFLNLTLLQEGVIQGHLIKNHNQNLKSFGLVKFPDNTKDLHSLLEESIHIL
jgi:hypothetical protein